MGSGYFEWRISAARGSESVAADIARHIHSRQHLGKIVIVCDQPIVMLSAVRKQWLKLCRSIQKQRASTLNADKILKYTHTITRMQHMSFTIQPPLEKPSADLFFATVDDLVGVPPRCVSVYVIHKLVVSDAEVIAHILGEESLVVDYGHSEAWRALGLAPKSKLEDEVLSEWGKMQQFLSQHRIDATTLVTSSNHNLEAMDDALDALLNVSKSFLEAANTFQHAMEIARPLRTPKEIRLQYDAIILLAHRVQALGPGAFTQRFLESYNEDDTFFLYDSLRADMFQAGESLVEIIDRHRKAGRTRLVNALLDAAFSSNY